MDFYSTWSSTRDLGINDSAFKHSFLENSAVSLSVLINGSDDEIIRAVRFLDEFPETELLVAIAEREPCELDSADIPCFSTFTNGAVRLNELLEFAPKGLTYADMGNQLIGARGQFAQVKYGENHAKLAAMMSLVVISEHRPAVVKNTALGHYLVAIPFEEKTNVLKKLLFRDPCIQAIIQAAINGTANYKEIVKCLSNTTAYRRRTSVKHAVEFALDLPGTKYLLERICWDL